MDKMRKVVMIAGAVAAAICANGAPTAGDTNPKSSAVDDSNWSGGPTEDWFVNWDKALAEAKKTNKKLFLLNTGSDWCYWCYRSNRCDWPSQSSKQPRHYRYNKRN